MPQNSYLYARIDPKLKAAAQKKFREQYGLSMSAAIRVLIDEFIKRKSFNFPTHPVLENAKNNTLKKKGIKKCQIKNTP